MLHLACVSVRGLIQTPDAQQQFLLTHGSGVSCRTGIGAFRPAGVHALREVPSGQNPECPAARLQIDEVVIQPQYIAAERLDTDLFCKPVRGDGHFIAGQGNLQFRILEVIMLRGAEQRRAGIREAVRRFHFII